MLYFLLGWGLLAVVSVALGAVIFVDLAPVSPQRPTDRLLLASWLGLGMTALLLLLVSLVTPLTPLIGWALVLTLVVRSLLQRQVLADAIGPLQGSRRSMLAGAFVILGLAFWVNRPITWQDTGYYHASLVQWLGSYGTVPGLALIFQNLGFSSAWFALAAPLNPSILRGSGLAVTNSFAFLLLIAQWGLGVRSVLRKRANLADWFSTLWGSLLIPTVLFLNPMAEILRSPSPDLPVTILVGVIAWTMLGLEAGSSTRSEQGLEQRSEQGSDQRSHQASNPGSNDRFIPVFLAVIAVSFKVIALPLLPITVGFAIWRESWKSWKSWRFWRSAGVAIAIALTGLLPLIFANLVTSGCPLYPGNVLCLDLPWSPTRTSIASTALITHGWMHWYGTPPPGVHPWIWAVSQWWGTSTREKITAIGVGLGALIGGVTLVLTIRRSGLKAWTKQVDEPMFWVSSMGLFGLGFVMAMSPFFRFTLPYILLLFTVGGLLIINRWKADHSQPASDRFSYPPDYLSDYKPAPLVSRPMLLSALSLLVLLIILYRSTLVLPPPMAYRSSWSDRMTNGIRYLSPTTGDVDQESVPHKDMCWNAPIPCAYEISPWIHFRDADRGPAGGFIRK